MQTVETADPIANPKTRKNTTREAAYFKDRKSSKFCFKNFNQIYLSLLNRVSQNLRCKA